MNPYDLVSKDFLAKGQYLSETPDDVADKMVELLDMDYFGLSTLDPCAGKGALMKAMIRRKEFKNCKQDNVSYCELNEENREICKYIYRRLPLSFDFFKLRPADCKFQRIIVNPPFKTDAEHLIHCLKFVDWYKTKLVALLHDYYLTSNEPRHIALRKELTKYNTKVIPVGELEAVILTIN